MSDYPVNKQLCVLPSVTGKESQFEAFQSIIANILNSEIDSPYYFLCQQNNISLQPENTINKKNFDGIYYKIPVGGSTHFIAVKNKQKMDPYEYFQPKNTQGFCQLFAFFLYTENIEGFQIINVQKINNKKKVSIDNFEGYVLNTFQCLQKLLTILKENKQFYNLFKQSFDQLKISSSTYYGIKSNTTFTTFCNDLKKLTVQSVMYYIYDNPLQGHLGASKPEIWDFIMDFEEENDHRQQKRQQQN